MFSSEGRRFSSGQARPPRGRPLLLYKQPDWVADDKAWLYAFGRILRAAMTGAPDFTTRRYVLTEEPTRYRGLVSSWSSRRIGLLNSAQGLMNEPSPISLGSPASCHVCFNGLALTSRPAFQRWRYTRKRLVKLPELSMPVLRTNELCTGSAVTPRSMQFLLMNPACCCKIAPCESQLFSRCDQCCRILITKIRYWTPAVMAQHRRHLAEVCRPGKPELAYLALRQAVRWRKGFIARCGCRFVP